MREIMYAGGSFVTSDEVATALLEYAAALANSDRSATVHVPAAIDGDEPNDVLVLVGPASQLMAEECAPYGRDPDAHEFLATVRQRMELLTRSYSVSADAGSALDWDI
jgi:hypothetical protein